MVGEVHASDEPVWRGTSLYLATGVRVAGEPTAAERLPAPTVVPSQQWRLAPDLGRRYAEVSGDFNPIHLSPATSRLFGFRRPIIHGMWTHARALAGLGRVPDAYRARVQFAKPIALPGRVGFAATRRDSGWSFAVVGKEGKPHLVGELAPEKDVAPE
jgi:acyl dehydratase